MVGQKVGICAHKGPLCAYYRTSVRECSFHYKNIFLYFFELSMWSVHPAVHVMTLYLFAGTSTPPGISATAVPSIATPIGVNGFSALPPQSNGQPTSEPIYTNGIHPYPGEPIKVCIKETWDTLVTSTVTRLLLWPWHSLLLVACTDWIYECLIILVNVLALNKNIT